MKFKALKLVEKDIRQDYNDYCKDKNLDPKNKKSKDLYLQDYSKWYAQYNGLSTLKAAKERVAKELEEDNILGQETPDETKAKIDSEEKGLYPKEDIENLEEDVDTGKDEENDSAEEIADEMQDETGAEEEEENSRLDAQLEDLREILPDLDLNLYQIINKEDTNKIFYFIGKVAEDSNDVLMLVDANPTDKEENNIINEIPKDESENDSEDGSDESEISEKFDFIKIPSKYDDLATMSPRYGDELNPNHEEVMEYLMGCLIKKDPKRAEELSSEKDVDDGSKVPLDQTIQSDIDDKIDFYSSRLNK